MKSEFNFTFGQYHSRALIRDDLPTEKELFGELAAAKGLSRNHPILAVCDTNTESIARKILGNGDPEIPLLILESGEKSKTWASVETILRAARDAGLGRDGVFIGIGGGVIGDLTGFAASIYMRGARFCLVSTTFLGMADACLGGKTGIDLLGIKNLAGTFYPAELVFIPLSALSTLPEREWKSGMAELIKIAILDSDGFLELIKKLLVLEQEGRNSSAYRECLKECISRSIGYKGSIVEADPTETGSQRPLLNLGHTFGHALEGIAGPGSISHGEAVAWGIARACELGAALGVTPLDRAREITGVLAASGYETRTPHPEFARAAFTDILLNAMMADKKQVAVSSNQPKNEAGFQTAKLRFIVPASKSARIISAADFPSLDNSGGSTLLNNIISGVYLI